MNVVTIIVVILMLIIMAVGCYFAYINLMNVINPTTSRAPTTTQPNCVITGCDPSGICTTPMCLEYYAVTVIDPYIMSFRLEGMIDTPSSNTFSLSNLKSNPQVIFVMNTSKSTITEFLLHFPKSDSNQVNGYVANPTGTIVIQTDFVGQSDDSNNFKLKGVSVPPGKGLLLFAGRLNNIDAGFQVTITSITI